MQNKRKATDFFGSLRWRMVGIYLLVTVLVDRDPRFQRQEYDLYSSEPITFTQAALGGKITVTTIDGPYELEIKPGTQTDTKVKLKGKGVPTLRNKTVRGDHCECGKRHCTDEKFAGGFRHKSKRLRHAGE